MEGELLFFLDDHKQILVLLLHEELLAGIFLQVLLNFYREFELK